MYIKKLISHFSEVELWTGNTVGKSRIPLFKLGLVNVKMFQLKETLNH